MPRAYGLTNAAPYASAPAVGAAGDTYFNTTDTSLYVSDGTGWVKAGPGAGGPPSGAASGDLAGTYPSPTVAKVSANSLTVGTSTTAGKLYLAPRGAIYTGGGSTTNVDFSGNADSTVPSYDQATAGWLWRLGSGAGNDWCNLYRRPPASATFTQQMMTIDSVGNFTILGATATKAAPGTAWVNPSDPRLKRDVGPYVVGLDAITQLSPISFKYNGLGGTVDDGQVCHGFDTAAVQAVMPECVGTQRRKLHADDETETEIATMDVSDITLALVNAVKELSARVVALEALMRDRAAPQE